MAVVHPPPLQRHPAHPPILHRLGEGENYRIIHMTSQFPQDYTKYNGFFSLFLIVNNMNTTFFPEHLIHSRNAESIDEHFSNITHSHTSLSEFEMRQIKLTE
jgi:hypothetical protein